MMSRDNRRREDREERARSRRAQRVIDAQKAKRRRMLTIIGGVAGAAVIVVGLLVLFNLESNPAAADEPVNPAPPTALEVETEGRAKGDPAAPVTVIEYGDFQ